jgi:uncharacterized protein (DUF1015 family)
VPQIRPFRALRYVPGIGDLSQLVAPPYDVISAEERERLVERHPKNVVRLDFPIEEEGDAPDDRYRRAARTLAAWRSDGTFRKDPRPGLYLLEQTYRLPGAGSSRTTRGFFGRLKLEAFGPGSGVLPHEGTIAGPREDRYKLLRATGVNTSPTVGLVPDQTGRIAHVLADQATAPPDVEATDDARVANRLWVLPDDGDPDGPVANLVGLAGAEPVTIADGHHRYETALRYRDERRMSLACEEDPAFDYVLMLFAPASDPPTVLATHRVVRDVGDDGVGRLLDRLDSLFEVRTPVSADELRVTFGSARADGSDSPREGLGRFGLWTRWGGALLIANRPTFAPFLPDGGSALRDLDVTLLGVALDRLCGIDSDALMAGGRLTYTKSVDEAIAWVDDGTDGADVAFLLDPTPIRDITAVAADGDVMPQKSTYFYPKAPTGLVINPHES